MIAGLLALLKEQFPNDTNFQIRDKLIQKAKESQQYLNLHTYGEKDISYGWGMPDFSPYGERKTLSPTSMALLDSTTYIYDYPSKNSTYVGYMSPQTVTAYEQWGDWYLVDTWLGRKWIKPETYNPQWFYHNITLNEHLYLYDAPYDYKEYLTGYNTKQFTSLDPQTVYASQKYGEWYKVSTWIGDKWVHPKDSFVDGFPIRLVQTEPLYANYGDAFSNGLHLNPQDVTGLWRVGDWFKVSTWAGELWIHSKRVILGPIQSLTGTMWVGKGAYLHDQPLSDTRRSEWIAPQDVYLISKWKNWYQISTSLGSKWIFNR